MTAPLVLIVSIKTFHVVKNLFRHRKTRYRGLAKNTAQLFSLFGFANLVLARGSLLGTDTQGAS
jgi:IS5 family transposase